MTQLPAEDVGIATLPAGPSLNIMGFKYSFEYNFVSYAEVDWGGVMAAAVAIMAPAILLTMFFQKCVVKGLTMGAVKG